MLACVNAPDAALPGDVDVEITGERERPRSANAKERRWQWICLGRSVRVGGDARHGVEKDSWLEVSLFSTDSNPLSTFMLRGEGAKLPPSVSYISEVVLFEESVEWAERRRRPRATNRHHSNFGIIDQCSWPAEQPWRPLRYRLNANLIPSYADGPLDIDLSSIGRTNKIEQHFYTQRASYVIPVKYVQTQHRGQFTTKGLCPIPTRSTCGAGSRVIHPTESFRFPSNAMSLSKSSRKPFKGESHRSKTSMLNP